MPNPCHVSQNIAIGTVNCWCYVFPFFWEAVAEYNYDDSFHSTPASHLVMANPRRVLKKRVSGFDFQKPGYPGRVSGFQKCIKLAIFG